MQPHRCHCNTPQATSPLSLHLSAAETLSATGLFGNLKSTHACLCLCVPRFPSLYVITEPSFLRPKGKQSKRKNRNYSNTRQIATTSAPGGCEPFGIIRNQWLIFLTQLLPRCNWEVGVGKQRWMYSFSTPPRHPIQWKCPRMCSCSQRVRLSEFWGHALKEQAASRQSQRSSVRPLRLSVSNGLD